MQNTDTAIKLLWIPSHCIMSGNDKANELANKRDKMTQKNTITTYGIVKAKIRLSPLNEIKVKWPKEIWPLYSHLRHLLQEEVDNILKWADQWKMKFNKDKTIAVLIYSSNSDKSWDVGIRTDNDVMETVKEFKFLWVLIDSGLRFNILHQPWPRWSHTDGTKRYRYGDEME